MYVKKIGQKIFRFGQKNKNLSTKIKAPMAPKNWGHETNLVQKNVCWQKRSLKILGPKSLVKMGSITAGILLIYTNVAWTNVIMAIGLW